MGVLAILIAYALVTFNLVEVKSYPYQLLNLLGAVGLIVETTYNKDRQPAVLNSIWALVAIVGIVQLTLQ